MCRMQTEIKNNNNNNKTNPNKTQDYSKISQMKVLTF